MISDEVTSLETTSRRKGFLLQFKHNLRWPVNVFCLYVFFFFFFREGFYMQKNI